MQNMFRSGNMLNRANSHINQDQEQLIQVPLRPLIQISNNQMLCQQHSTPGKKNYITHFNLNFLDKKQPKINQKVFLCEKCCYQLSRKYSDSQFFDHIKTKEQFQSKYIKQTLYKYASYNNQWSQIFQTFSNAQKCYLTEIDKLRQKFNESLANYTNMFTSLFGVLKRPVDFDEYQKFKRGRFNAGMLQKFYNNSKKVQKYKALIGRNSKEAIEKSLIGVAESFIDIEKKIKKLFYESSVGITLYMKNYDSDMIQTQSLDNDFKQFSNKRQKSEMVHEEMEKKQQSRPIKNKGLNIQKNKNSLPNAVKTKQQRLALQKQKQHEKRRQEQQIKIKQKGQSRKRMRQISDSQQNSQNSLQNSANETLQAQRANVNKYERQRIQNIREHKTKIIRKNISDNKPARNSDIEVLEQEYLKSRGLYRVSYIIHRSGYDKQETHKVHRMDRKQFKRKYPRQYAQFIKK